MFSLLIWRKHLILHAKIEKEKKSYYKRLFIYATSYTFHLKNMAHFTDWSAFFSHFLHFLFFFVRFFVEMYANRKHLISNDEFLLIFDLFYMLRLKKIRSILYKSRMDALRHCAHLRRTFSVRWRTIFREKKLNFKILFLLKSFVNI